jgi:IS5 family transposase
VLVDKLGDAGKIDWSRAAVDSASVAAKGGECTGPNPTDKGKPGTKRQRRFAPVVDAKKVPLAVICTPANVHDSNAHTDVVDAIKPIKKKRVLGRGRRKRPSKLHADKGYDFERCRSSLRKRGHHPSYSKTCSREHRAIGEA